ncbi:hypothetical protein MACH26_18420 [Planctobacterium marinum]|uniref:Uncharacterized protein n=1 Tax=Planctobacterium marinum TaxID=1631968 RepID=A0AA48HH54_9ALTE|nr:hypothetical protein MACH26_18420 [Planctobacterium marinum]
MGFHLIYVPFIILFTACLPGLLTFRLTKKQGRPAFNCTTTVVLLGLFTVIGGWLLYLLLHLSKCKNNEPANQV